MQSVCVLRRLFVLFTLLSLLIGANAVAVTPPPTPTNKVDDSTDSIHNTLPGDCEFTGNQPCSLHDLIKYSNTAGGIVIGFENAITSYALAQSLPSVIKPVTIVGKTGAVTRVEIVGAPGRAGFQLGPIPGATNPGTGAVLWNLVIRNMSGDGVAITDGGNQVLNCYIGVAADGLTPQPNGTNGVSITTSALTPPFTPPWDPVAAQPFNAIGDAADATLGNVISGNTASGVVIFAQHTVKNVVANNMIGVDVTGKIAVPNGQYGVTITGNAFDNTIGPGNVISGNTGPNSDGVFLTAQVLYPNRVTGNTIGASIDIDPLNNLGNGRDGIRIDATTIDAQLIDLTPSRTAEVVGNIIGFNAGNGITVTGAAATPPAKNTVRILGNSIGLSGVKPIGNGIDGIRISNPLHTIGTSTPADQNVISKNAGSGIMLLGGATDVVIQGNIIGRNSLNTLAFPNTNDGITIDGGGNHTIGGAGAGEGNIIAGNGRNGIKLINGTFSNLITHNSIFSNHQSVSGLGIDLDDANNAPDHVDNTPTQDPNIPPATGTVYANYGQNAPVINGVTYVGGVPKLDWTIQTASSTPLTLEIFASAAPGSQNNGEGETWIATITATTDGSGVAGSTSTTLPATAANKYVTMTATSTNTIDPPGPVNSGPANNTSEFSNPFLVPDPVTHFDVTAPASVNDCTAFSFTVTARTASNAVATGYTGTVHFTPSDPQHTVPPDYTFVGADNGVHTFTNGATISTTGNQTITATDTVTASINGTSNTIAVNPGPAVNFTVSAPPGTTAGVPVIVTVTAKDACGNTATGYSGTVHFTSGDSQAVLPADSTLASGTGSFPVTLKSSGNQSVTATDTVTASITGSTNVLVASTSATHLIVTAPGSANANSAFSFTVTAKDQFNNTATGYTGTVHFTSSDGLAVLPGDYPFVVGDNGVHTFTNGATLNTAGNRTITATDTVTASINGTSGNIAVSAAATHFSVSAPAVRTAGLSFSVTVTAQDAGNLTVTSYGGTVHLTSSDGIAILPADSTLTNGVGTFPVTLKTLGNQSVTATDTVTPSITGTTNVLVKPTRSDFDSDGKSDLLWRNSVTGQNALWLMNGPAITSVPMLTTISDLNWKVAGIGDFNGDGHPDILWWHSVTGQVSLWLMNGTTIASPLTVGTIADTNWKIAGVDDLDGDGKSDIVWRHALTGQVAVWLMNGGAIFSAGTPSYFADLNWNIAGVGDLNGDGKADLFWRNGATGQNLIWFMNGTSIASVVVTDTVADVNYKVAAITDLNGDGKSDVFWWNQSTHDTVAWLMNGATVSSFAYITTIIDGNWRVEASGDFNGDGNMDVAWRNIVTQDTVFWMMSGLTKQQGLHGNQIDPNWVMVGPR